MDDFDLAKIILMGQEQNDTIGALNALKMTEAEFRSKLSKLKGYDQVYITSAYTLAGKITMTGMGTGIDMKALFERTQKKGASK